jgi:SSS family solute:Na+ symporter
VDAYGYIFVEDTENIYYILIGLYLVGMIVVGIVHALRIRTALEYLAAGRDVGFWGTMGTVVATVCGAAAFIGFVGQGYSSGISGFFLWVLPAIFFGLIFALCFGRRLRELGIFTLSDAFSLRYGKTAGLFPALIQIFVLAAPMLGAQILGLGVVFHTFFGLSLTICIYLGFIIIVVYTFFGGLPTCILTDIIQAVVLSFALILFFFLGLKHGREGFNLFTSTPQAFWKPFGQGGFLSFLASSITIGMSFLIWQSLWQRNYIAQSNGIAIWGVLIGLVFSCILLSLSFLIGISALGFLEPGLRPMEVFTVSIKTIFPPTLGAMIIVGLVSAIMSGADSFIMMATASISRDIYQRYFRPDASNRQILFFSRLGVVGFSCLGLIIAFAAQGIIPLLMLSFKTTGASLVIPFLALMFWKNSTRSGVIWGMVAGLLTTMVLYFYSGQSIWPSAWGYACSLAVTIAVSILTAHADDEQVKALYFQMLDTEVNLNFGTIASRDNL